MLGVAYRKTQFRHRNALHMHAIAVPTPNLSGGRRGNFLAQFSLLGDQIRGSEDVPLFRIKIASVEQELHKQHGFRKPF
jgi:hypothetical protein